MIPIRDPIKAIFDTYVFVFVYLAHAGRVNFFLLFSLQSP
jgi:hypothetical protein